MQKEIVKHGSRPARVAPARACLAVGMALALLAAAAGQAANDVMSVQVRQGPVRATPSFTGQVVATLTYGAPVAALEKRPGWIRISAGGTTGWMHESALSKKRIVMSAGATTAQTGASSEEVALAGKGFNSDVEAQYKAQNRNVNYAAVDRMEKQRIDAAEMARFLKEGGVQP